MDFDQIMPLLNLTALPSILRSRATNSLNNLLSQLEEWWDTMSPEDMERLAPNIRGMSEDIVPEGWSKKDWAAIMLAFIWALEANAPYGQSRFL